MSQETTPQQTKPLSWVLTKSSLIAVVAGMAAYTLFEVITSGEFDTREIITHHLIPTVFIGAIIWAVLTIRLRSKVIRPVREILDHLNRVGSGRLAPLERTNEITEIKAIVAGLNQLTDKLKNASDSEGSSKAVDDLVKLRADLRQVIDCENITPDQLVPIMKNLGQLEGHLLAALQAENTVSTV